MRRAVNLKAQRYRCVTIGGVRVGYFDGYSEREARLNAAQTWGVHIDTVKTEPAKTEWFEDE